ncbi:MAG: HEPN domain-containing protein [Clostridium sp.]|nr:HEPN domain-containing protein [Clostridium sp.]MCM1207508.1 HEPN domain-containing protein [Ruminococcus sp.]
MEEMNSYYGRALSDYRYAKHSMPIGEKFNDYNNVAALCEQAAEKYLKAVLEVSFSEDEEVVRLLRTHNLRSLYNKLKTRYDLSISSKDCVWLGNFYYDARYPGDNFTVVTKEDACECIRIVENIQKDADTVLEAVNQERKKQASSLKDLKKF